MPDGAVVRRADMPDDMQEDAVDAAKIALSRYISVQNIAACIEREFDRLYGAKWHCVVGQSL
jgi:Dynein light chain type 1